MVELLLMIFSAIFLRCSEFIAFAWEVRRASFPNCFEGK